MKANDDARLSVLLIHCTDERGLLHRIAGALSKRGANIVENNEFVDNQNKVFFMRTVFSGDMLESGLLEELRAVLPQDSQITLKSNAPKKLILFGTREAHCLGDLLLRHSSGELRAEIAAVVSNHPELENLVKRFEIPYYYVPAENRSREEHERAVLEALKNHEHDYLVLAKYMRILSADFVSFYPNRILNIHHSFLPAFIGAKPYQQAYDRGVKILGATAHFVNNNLDDGPIIAQDVIRTHHAQDAAAMAHAGRDLEKTVLGRALELVLEDRVLVHGNRTIIFE